MVAIKTVKIPEIQQHQSHYSIQLIIYSFYNIFICLHYIVLILLDIFYFKYFT